MHTNSLHYSSEPLTIRRNVPFFCHKSSLQYRSDKYERYADIVSHHLLNHFGTSIWKEGYPYKNVLNFILANLPLENTIILDVGCGAGKILGTLAQQTLTQCYGVDYSYQMIRAAHEIWKWKIETELNYNIRGFPSQNIPGRSLGNIHFAVANAQSLPFADHSISTIVSTFLFDRLDDPEQFLRECSRVLDMNSTFIMVMPQNYQQGHHWQQFFPVTKLVNAIKSFGFNINIVNKDIHVNEILDNNNNSIHWHCVGIVAQKNSHLTKQD